MASNQLLISPSGRINRFSYSLLTGAFSLMNFGVAALIIYQNGGDPLILLTLGPIGLISLSPGLGALICVGVWFQVCLVFKRSRDASNSAVLGWMFIGSWLGPYLVFNGGLGTVSNFGLSSLVFGAPAMVVGMILLLKGSVQPQVSSTADDDKLSFDENLSGLGTLDDDTDLVARAAVLRAAADQTVVQQTPVAAKTVPSTRPQGKGFGRRNLAPSHMR